jgi:hypothetical protein
MSGFLLDTNCISEVVRIQPEPRVLEWMESADEGLLYLSVLTLGEIRKGLASLPQSKRRTNLEAGWKSNCKPAFPGEFCPSMRLLPAAGDSLPLTQSGRERLCRLSTLCWWRQRSTTISRSSHAMRATSQTHKSRF